MPLNLSIHHMGCVVESIEESLETYTNLLGFEDVSEIHYVSSQEVNVCFVNVGNGTYMELVEPLDETSAIARLLKKRQSYYHVGYLVDSFDQTITDLVENGAKMITSFISEAFDNKRCAFLYTKELHMIEIIESSNR